MKKTISIILSIVLCVVLLSSCNSGTTSAPETSTAPQNSSAAPAQSTTSASSAPSDAPAAPASSAPSGQTQGAADPLEGKKVAIILKGLANYYWQTAEKGAIQAEIDLNVEVDIFAPVEFNNNEQQIRLVQEAIAKKYDVICISPCDSNGIIPAIEEANRAGIPIVNFATIINGGDRVTYMAIENYDAQYRVTKATCELIQYGEVVILEGPAGQQNALDKVNGAVDAISEFPDITIVASQVANWSRTEGFTVMQNLLQRNPDIRGVISCNDDMALGALEALDEAGRAGEVFVCGTDCTPEALDAIKIGRMHVDVDSMSYELAYDAIAAAVDILNGKSMDEEIILDALVVTIDNVDEVIQKKLG